ncbi:MAG: HesA/MoeB/ThiF family protein [Bacteroidota bacterium]
MEDRYSRHILLDEIGLEGQQKLQQAKVLVVGAGGLGCPVLQYLAAAGIGTLGVIDDDVVALSNLQRQVLFGTSHIGENKALIAREKLTEMNPNIEIHAYPEKLGDQNVISLFSQYDIIVDGTDNFPTRYLINDACVLLDRPMVYGAIFKFEGQVSVFNYEGGPTYRCLFPIPPKPGAVPNCSDIGVLGVLPGIIGTLQANEVLKMVLGIGNILSGKIYNFNALTYKSLTLSLARLDKEVEKIKERGENFEHMNTEFCDPETWKEIRWEDITSKEQVVFLDVRGRQEEPRITSKGVLEIPLDELTESLHLIPKNRKVVTFCKSGMRSKQAVKILQQHRFSNCFSLKDGIIAFDQMNVN